MPATRGRTARDLIPGPVRSWAATALRLYGMATSSLRPLPDFLIIGGKRCGTTSLYGYLRQHPCVAPLFPSAVKVKGVHYFDREFHRGLPWYRSHFATGWYRRRMERLTGHPAMAGEASSYCLFHPMAAERSAAVVPEARLIVLLRNPTERAHSHYRARVAVGMEPLTFEDAIAGEAERTAGEAERLGASVRYWSYAHEHFSYVSQGVYADSLQAWMGVFPRERFLILRSEGLFSDPARVLGTTLEFLGLPRWEPHTLGRLNAGPLVEPMDARTRRRLDGYFAPHNARLEGLLGMPMHWDSPESP